MTQVYLQGKACQTNGDLPAVGRQAPDFSLISNDLKTKNLGSYSDVKKLIYIVPSLDTMVCAKTTKALNALAEDWEAIQLLVVSADLPFAQQRFIKQSKLKNITTLSMMRDKQFATDYGVLLVDGPLAGLAARAVLVLDRDNKIQHTELVSDITRSPDFDQIQHYF